MDIPIKTYYFFLLNISRNLNIFGKIDWSMNSGQRRAGIARDIKKKKKKRNFHFQNSTKSCKKDGTI